MTEQQRAGAEAVALANAHNELAVVYLVYQSSWAAMLLRDYMDQYPDTANETPDNVSWFIVNPTTPQRRN